MKRSSKSSGIGGRESSSMEVEPAKMTRKQLIAALQNLQKQVRTMQDPKHSSTIPLLTTPKKPTHVAGTEPTQFFNAVNKDISSSKICKLNKYSAADTLDFAICDCRQKAAEDPNSMSCIVLSNSPGQGKTRACYEHCKGEKTIYIQCLNKGGSSPRVSSPFVLDAISEINYASAASGERENLCAKFLYALQEAAKCFPSLEELNEAQFETGTFFEKFGEIWIWTNVKKTTPEAVKRKRVQFQEPISVDFVKAADESDVVQCIIFDEADAFQSAADASSGTIVPNQFHPMRCLQRQINGYGRGLVAVFASTTSCAALLKQGHVGSGLSCSLPAESRFIDYPTVVDIVNHDLYRGEYTCGSSWDLYTLGRPLWYSKLNFDFSKGSLRYRFNQLVDFVFGLLTHSGERHGQISLTTGPEHLRESKNFKCYLQIAFACVRVSFSTFQSSNNNVFVSHFLATVTAINNSNQWITSAYPSEPVIAEAIASAVLKDKDEYDMLAIMTAVHEDIKSKKILSVPTGDMGEFVAAAACIAHLDALRVYRGLSATTYNAFEHRKFSFSSDVPVVQFLAHLRADRPLSQKIIRSLDGFVVNLSHFVRIPPKITDSVVKEAFRRCAGFILSAGFVGVDLLIVMCHLARQQYGCISVQVKNLADKISSSVSRKFQFAARKHVYTSCKLFKDSPEVVVLLAVGSGGVKFSCECLQPRPKKQLRIRGLIVQKKRPNVIVLVAAQLSNFVLLDVKLIEVLQSLANINRPKPDEAADRVTNFKKRKCEHGSLGILGIPGEKIEITMDDSD